MAGRILNSKAREELADYIISAAGFAVYVGQLRILYKCAVIAIGKDDNVHFPIVAAALTDRAEKLKSGNFKW